MNSELPEAPQRRHGYALEVRNKRKERNKGGGVGAYFAYSSFFASWKGWAMGTLLDLARSAATKEVDDERLDPAMEERRRKVLRQLAENPNIVRAVELADEHTDPNDLIIAVAIRGVATFEMREPKAKVDA